MLSQNEYLVMAHRQLMTSSLRRFTAEMFQYVHKTPFIFGRHHLLICDALDAVVRGECTKLIINIAPRYGKTELVSKMFPAYGFAVNPKCRFIHLSYSGGLVTDNSIAVKDIIRTPLYEALFSARIQFGRDTRSKWDTTEGGGLYATSTLGQITGFGAGATDTADGEVNEAYLDEYSAVFNPHKFTGAIVIDDPIRPEDALSDTMREAVNRRFETTIRNRVNSRRTPIIIIMQRLHEHDLCGYLEEVEPDDWKVLSIPAIYYDENGNEQALWPHKHSLEELHKIEEVNQFVFDTQYMQNPIPLEGLMYEKFKTYEVLPPDRCIRKNYTDTADTGSDNHCSICYNEYAFGLYVTDVLYNKKSMEVNEVEQANLLDRNDTQVALIEGNSGGRGFARNVERNLRTMGNTKCRVNVFTQSHNKQVRIFTHSADVQNMVYFPAGWERRWPQFYLDLKHYRKEGRNAHDDAPDAVTGLVENITKQNITRYSRT
ncbi:MAG: phage terminase large subunit [Clostridia bacterium]|nr:phage terminase large subunit [Clostridia bacterium]